jgi:UDP-N-acetylmuramoyl-L-alanyl-D-glutamate--2,6-diaminopimelate ligase
MMPNIDRVLKSLLSDSPLVTDLAGFGLCENSAMVQKGDVFIASATDLGQRQAHVEQALAAGAVAILYDQDANAPKAQGALMYAVENLAQRKSALAVKFYAAPSAQVDCVGITGTNGKTSIGFHVANFSDLLGVPCGYCGTLGWGRVEALAEAALTTPNAVEMQRRIANLRDNKITRLALEVSSHALAQSRIDDVQIDVAVFTNLTRDHLDFHKTMEDYGKAKSRLFTHWPLKLAVINGDDDFGRSLAVTARAQEVISYGKGGDVSWRASPVSKGMQVKFATPWGKLDCVLPVVADFAIANIAASMAVMMGMGHKLSDLSGALNRMSVVPGRMQVLGSVARKPQVVVDYAHTPDAVHKVLAAIRPKCRGKVICVVGCGGDRDRGKRPEMAKQACAGSDATWLTSDNPRGENPESIIQDMLSGVDAVANSNVYTEVDRGKAIQGAIESAGSDDVVLIAGKGHEDTQEICGQRIRFSDVEYAEKILRSGN